MAKPVRIEITNYCNRRCEYCFFNDRLTAHREEMTSAEFSRILDLCDKEDRKFVFIQGGEPTSHSNFMGFMDTLKDRGFNFGLFTNGIFNPEIIGRLKFDKNDEILVNYNHPSTYASPREWELVNGNLEKMVARNISFNIGYNLYKENPDYGYFIDAIKKYGINHIRWDVARPSEKFTNTYFSFDDYFKLVPAMVGFIKAYMKEGCYFNYDCPIPMCILLKKEFGFINHNTDVTRLTSCGALLNIGPGLKIATCPASVAFKDITIDDFSGLSQAEEFLRRQVDDLRWGVWMSGICENCVYRLMKECQGGCVGHKRAKRNKTVGRKELETFLNGAGPGAAGGGFEGEMSFVPASSVTACVDRYISDIQKGPPDPYLFYSLGRSYEMLEDYAGAIKAYESALAADGSYLLAKVRMNLAYQLATVQRNPGNAGAWSRLEGAMKQLTGDNGKIEAMMRQYKSRYSR